MRNVKNRLRQSQFFDRIAGNAPEANNNVRVDRIKGIFYMVKIRAEIATGMTADFFYFKKVLTKTKSCRQWNGFGR